MKKSFQKFVSFLYIVIDKCIVRVNKYYIHELNF
jgi:hypothetical protein